MKKRIIFSAIMVGLFANAYAITDTNPLYAVGDANQLPAISQQGQDLKRVELSVIAKQQLYNLYTAKQKADAGCDEQVWIDLSDKYVDSRGAEKVIASIMQVGNQMGAAPNATPPSPTTTYANPTNWSQCASNTMNKIESIKSQINGIISIFTGKPDVDALKRAALGAACQVANKSIDKATSPVLGQVDGVLGQGQGAINQVTGAQIGVGGVPITNVGSVYTPGSTNTINGNANQVFNNTVDQAAQNADTSSWSKTFTDGVAAAKKLLPF